MAYGLVYHYFENKEEVLLSIFRENWQVFLKVLKQICLEGDVDFEKRLQHLIRFLIESYDNYPDLLKVIIIEVTRSNRFREEESIKLFQSTFEIVAKMLRKAQRAGHARKDIDSRVASYLLLGTVEALLTGRVVGAEQFGNQNTAQIEKAIIGYALGGMLRS